MLKDKIILVSGGTRGIGLAIVKKLAGLGGEIHFCARNKEKNEECQQKLQAEGLTVTGWVCDVTKKDDIPRLIKNIVNKAGRIDILVNNAGSPGGGETKSIPDELWEKVININLNSVFRMTREVLNYSGMLERKWGRIINIASTGGKQGVVLGAPYSASKHGVVGFSKALGLELAKTGVTVNAVCPGFVETELAAHVREGYADVWKCTPAEALARIEARIPTGRYVEPEEVADLVAFLSTPATKSITAQAINVCGGLGNY